MDEITAKFLMPELKGVNAALKLAALRAMTDLAAALHDEEMWAAAAEKEEENKGQPRLAHHGDLMHEVIACLKVSYIPKSIQLGLHHLVVNYLDLVVAYFYQVN